MSRWKTIFVWAGTIVAVGGAYVWFFGFQTASAILVRYKYRTLPDVAKVPVPLQDQSISSVQHRTASYFGYEFELPWDDVDEAKSKTTGPIHVEGFHSGNALWFSTFPPKSFVKGFEKNANLDEQELAKLYGEDAVASDYGFHKKMLERTPTEITPFMPEDQAISRQTLLMVKAISMPKASSGIFSIEAQDFNGFQFEDPRTQPSRITVELYSNDGGVDLIFMQKAGAPQVSQAEINRVVRSIHKTSLTNTSLTVTQHPTK
jgi:hypothetical protein